MLMDKAMLVDKAVLMDKAAFPRDKTCGDGLTVLALGELANLGGDVGQCDSTTQPAYAMLRLPAGRTARLPLPAMAGRMQPGPQALDRQAASAGDIATQPPNQ